jgi:hypothetical protein
VPIHESSLQPSSTNTLLQNVLGVSMLVCDSCNTMVQKCVIAPGATEEPHLCRSCFVDSPEWPVHVVRRSDSECAPVCIRCLQTPLFVEALCYLRRHDMLVEQSAEVEAIMASRAKWTSAAANASAASPARTRASGGSASAGERVAPESTPARPERAAKSSALTALAATPSAAVAAIDESSDSADDVPVTPTSTAAVPAPEEPSPLSHDAACCACERQVGGAEEFVRCAYADSAAVADRCRVVKCHRCIRERIANEQTFRKCIACWMCTDHRD